MTGKIKGIIITTVCILLCLLPLVAGMLLYGRLPEQLPIHYNAEGIADHYVGKIEAILLLPSVCTILTIALSFMFRTYPDRNLKIFISTLIIGPLIACGLSGLMYYNALGYELNAMKVTMVIMGILFIAVGNYIPTVRPNGLIGARFPWIMDDDNAWEKTQRFTGKLMLLLGLTYLLEAFAYIGGENGAVIWLMASVLGMLVVTGIYSYMVAQNG